MHLDSTGQMQQKRVDTGRGCMKCREKQLISKFADLREGEHIEMRGNIRCCNDRSVYSHHAIVDSVQPLENDDQKANVSLLGLPDTGGQIRQEDRELHLARDKVRLIEYNMRKFDLAQTKERARSVADRGMKVPYRLFTRNCENFSTVCVVGNDDIDTNLSDSTTQQGRSFFFGVFNCICIGSRFGGSLISFFLYITFVAGDNIIDVVPKSSAAIFSKMCKVNSSTPKGAHDHRICHLKIQSIFFGVYLLYVICCTCYICSAKFICKRCKFKSVLIVVSRFLLYCLLELILIWTESMVFAKIRKWLIEKIKIRIRLRQFILVVIAFVKSAIECALIYWIANWIAALIPRYLVKKKSISGADYLKIGDVISWKRGTCCCSVDAIVTKVHSADAKLDLIYEECCTWTLFCTTVTKDIDVEIDPKSMKIYDFSDFSHKFSPQEVVNNAERKLATDDTHCGLLCCNRSSSFSYSAKVKDISCEERFNSCERCFRCICCL